ncbi:DolP-mannose mannosyltransferase [Halocatena marina]|uniref:DolP-mannose mannosyltransferase n=1 Tax=Halocatena marina TaxID=2934937 RepID=UPI00200F425F|nr:DolP-mannose mannosyltransferase [Halocatena marina]
MSYQSWRLNELFKRLHTHWWLSAVAVFAALQLSIYFPLRQTRRMLPDAAVFLLGGDLLAAGYAPYLRLWDVKPPMIYNTTALFALIAPGDPWTQFYLGSALTTIAAVVIVLLAASLTYRLTARPFAAFVTAVLIIGFHNFVQLPSVGIFPKYFTISFGLASVWCSLDDRPALASAFATIAAGYWQWGLIFVMLVYGRAWRQDRLAHWRPMVFASLCVTIIAVMPIVLLGGGVPMIVEVIIDVFRLGDHGQTLVDRIQKFIRFTGFLWPLLVAGVVGAVETAYRERAHYWLAAGALWPVWQIGFVDFDSLADLYLLLVFAAIGLGVAVGTLRLERHQQIIVVCLVLAFAGGQLYDMRQVLDTPDDNSVSPDANSSRGAFIDQRIPPESCSISMGEKMSQLYSDRPDSRYCGTQVPVG